MGRISVILPDELEERFRNYLYSIHGWKHHGKISEMISEALEKHLDELEGKGEEKE